MTAGWSYFGSRGLRQVGRCLPQRNRQLIGARQLLQVAQSEVLQEERRRAVQQRTTETFRAPDDIDESALVQRLEHATDVDAANVLDLRASDGLPIRDERQGLQRGGRQPLRTRGELGALDRFRVLGARENLPAAPDLDELDAVPFGVVMQSNLVERGTQRRGRRLRVERAELVQRDWSRAREERGLKQLR